LFAIIGSVLAVALPQVVSPLPPAKGVPPSALSRGSGVSASVRLTISPQGDVDRCVLLERSVYPALDSQICASMNAVKFSPAKDADGSPIYGVVTSQIHWMGREAREEPAAPDVDLNLAHMPAGASSRPTSQVAVIVNQQGVVEGCSIVGSSGVAALDAVACKQGISAASLKAARTKADAAVRSVQSLNVGFSSYAQVVLKRDPDYAALGAAGPFFPERALRLNVSGYAIIDCASDARGLLTQCVTKEESPKGYGFSEAALKMAETQWMKAAPGSGDHATIRVDFPASANFRPN